MSQILWFVFTYILTAKTCIPVWHLAFYMNHGVFMTEINDDYKLLSVEDIMGVMTGVFLWNSKSLCSETWQW